MALFQTIYHHRNVLEHSQICVSSLNTVNDEHLEQLVILIAQLKQQKIQYLIIEGQNTGKVYLWGRVHLNLK